MILWRLYWNIYLTFSLTIIYLQYWFSIWWPASSLKKQLICRLTLQFLLEAKKLLKDLYNYSVMFSYDDEKRLKFLNPHRADPGQRELINLIIYFHTSLWCFKRFYEGLKGLHKTFWATTKNAKIKISVTFYFNTTFWDAQGGKG